jgi:hypothetical protein
MSATSKSPVKKIDLVIRYELDGEMEECVESMTVQFLADDNVAICSSSGIFSDFRLLFGDHAIVTPLPSGQYELVGVVHPSPMRHFESSGNGSRPFPTKELLKVGGDWESELTLWTTHIPAAEFSDFCKRTELYFSPETEIFSGISSICL